MSRRGALSLLAAGVVAVCAGCSANDDGHGSAAAASTTSVESPQVFGMVIDAGSLKTLFPANRAQSWAYVSGARAYLVRYPGDKVAAAKTAYPKAVHAGLDAGLLALYQRCTHLGCRVPACESSGMFECPCHGGFFSAYGEWRGGPPPRGMDLFSIAIHDEHVLIDTTQVITGLGQSVDVSGQEPRGPHCVGSPR